MVEGNFWFRKCNYSFYYVINWLFYFMKFINNGNRNWIIKYMWINVILRYVLEGEEFIMYVVFEWYIIFFIVDFGMVDVMYYL